MYVLQHSFLAKAAAPSERGADIYRLLLPSPSNDGQYIKYPLLPRTHYRGIMLLLRWPIGRTAHAAVDTSESSQICSRMARL